MGLNYSPLYYKAWKVKGKMGRQLTKQYFTAIEQPHHCWTSPGVHLLEIDINGMKTRKKKVHFSMPHCDEVESASGQQLNYNNKNAISTRNADIYLHGIMLSGERTNQQLRFKCISSELRNLSKRAFWEATLLIDFQLVVKSSIKNLRWWGVHAIVLLFSFYSILLIGVVGLRVDFIRLIPAANNTTPKITIAQGL